MLKSLFHSQITLGFAQAGIASVLALAVILLARRRNIHLESDAAVALLRGIVQIVAVGSILMLLLKGPRWTSVFLLTGMIVAAGPSRPGAPRTFRERKRSRPTRSRRARGW